MSPRRALWPALLTLGLGISALSVLTTSASAAVVQNPPNTSPNAIHVCTTRVISAQCLQGALVDYNKARAKEHLGPMKLPANFRSMTVPMQVFTLTNIERRDRGLAPFAALAATLNPYTQPAADNSRDPYFPRWSYTTPGSQSAANWASPQNSLFANYLWMYDDGPGGTNIDCGSPGARGCWGHRRNILGAYSAPRVLGASVGRTGIATLMMGGDTHDWNLLKPNAPVNVRGVQVPNHRIKVTWAAPAVRGPAITAYYFRRDNAQWIKLTKLTWTTAPLGVGKHTVSLKSWNKNGYSPIRAVTFTVK